MVIRLLVPLTMHHPPLMIPYIWTLYHLNLHYQLPSFLILSGANRRNSGILARTKRRKTREIGSCKRHTCVRSNHRKPWSHSTVHGVLQTVHVHFSFLKI